MEQTKPDCGIHKAEAIDNLKEKVQFRGKVESLERTIERREGYMTQTPLSQVLQPLERDCSTEFQDKNKQ